MKNSSDLITLPCINWKRCHIIWFYWFSNLINLAHTFFFMRIIRSPWITGDLVKASFIVILGILLTHTTGACRLVLLPHVRYIIQVKIHIRQCTQSCKYIVGIVYLADLISGGCKHARLRYQICPIITVISSDSSLNSLKCSKGLVYGHCIGECMYHWISWNNAFVNKVFTHLSRSSDWNFITWELFEWVIYLRQKWNEVPTFWIKKFQKELIS